MNHPETVAFVTAAILEGIRDGRSVSDLMSYGATLLKKNDVMPGVAEMIPDLQVEGMPRIEVDQETYVVKADEKILTCDPMAILPMAQRYFVF